MLRIIGDIKTNNDFHVGDKMNKIIVLPGNADGVFFNNELNYLVKYFDKVIVVSYPYRKEVNRLATQEKIILYEVKPKLFKTILKGRFFNWLFDADTIKEIRNEFSFSKQGFKKLMYIFYYGLFYCEAKQYIDKEVLSNQEDNIFLYSFWLTRGAYTIANYKKNDRANIRKLISRAHGYDLYIERNSMNYLPFRGFINNNLDAIYFISGDGLNYFNKNYKCDRLCSKKYISRLGTFNPDSIQKEIYKKNKICIASCSSIISVKRLDLIIDVVSNIDIDVKWIHIGEGNQKEAIEEYANNRLKDKTFQFLGQIDNSKILETYLEYDVDFLINMSDSEGIPVSIMEAMSIGIPIIARDVGGVREIVNENTGLLIRDISNMESVFRQVNNEARQRLMDIEVYKNKQKECINLWNAKYNADKNYDDFFKELISGEIT